MLDASVNIAMVIGDPIEHSLSPLIFHSLQSLRDKHNSFVYWKQLVKPSQLKQWLVLMQQNQAFVGCNVTIPHKQAVVQYAGESSPEVQVIGAANVISYDRKKNKLKSYNTDVFGISKTLEEKKFTCSGKIAVLYGCGGAARAVAYVLGKQGCKEIFVVNRTQKNAKKFILEFSKIFKNTIWKIGLPEEKDLNQPVLLVNSTPMGMKGVKYQKMIPFKVRKGSLAFDLIYKPFVTGFLREAKSQGANVVGGLDMLIWQALKTHEIWFGKIGRIQYWKNKVKKILLSQL